MRLKSLNSRSLVIPIFGIFVSFTFHFSLFASFLDVVEAECEDLDDDLKEDFFPIGLLLVSRDR